MNLSLTSISRILNEVSLIIEQISVRLSNGQLKWLFWKLIISIMEEIIDSSDSISRWSKDSPTMSANGWLWILYNSLAIDYDTVTVLLCVYWKSLESTRYSVPRFSDRKSDRLKDYIWLRFLPNALISNSPDPLIVFVCIMTVSLYVADFILVAFT